MVSRFFISFFLLLVIGFNVAAKSSDNPFARTASLDIGTDISWHVDAEAVVATKSKVDDKGVYYHLRFNNKQLEFIVSSDAGGLKPKKFKQLEIKGISIDGKQSSLFKWCLKNQERHNRFLQQGLKVKKNICVIDGKAGSFVMRLNKDTLTSLMKGKQLQILLKPFRTPLELNYDISDFNDMYSALNTRSAPAAQVAALAATQAAVPISTVTASSKKVAAVNHKRICLAEPPVKYKNVETVEYDCADAAAKQDAELKVSALVSQEKTKQEKAAVEKEKQRKLAEEKKQQEMAAKLKQDEIMRVEAAAVAASEIKQAEISGEIAQKMLKVCEKYWDKGEHRCYCQKYIEHAPSEIQANSTCE